MYLRSWLSANRITSIAPGAFVGLGNLQYLWDSSLVAFERLLVVSVAEDSRTTCSHQLRMELSRDWATCKNCRLRILLRFEHQYRILASCRYLHDNKIISIPSQAFRGLTKLTFLCDYLCCNVSSHVWKLTLCEGISKRTILHRLPTELLRD